MPPRFFSLLAALFLLALPLTAQTSVKDDPLLRMPGTQPDQGVNLEGSNRCLNCHGGYDTAAEPGFNWKGSMMAQAARDPMWYACLAVAAQDSIWALGNPNATDLCIRCHSPAGWLGGRSEPTNVSALTGDDFDGLSCDFCHTTWDPFFEDTYHGLREGSDWSGYWDEAGNTGPGSGTLSQNEADLTYVEDATLALGIRLLTGQDFFVANRPRYATYDANGSGQFFVSTSSQKRASFADAAARHQMLYSRVHKSKHMCETCHDVSNPVLANLGLSGLPDQSGGADQISEQYSAYSYMHVERTFSEFMSSAYGQPGGAATNPEFQAQGAPDITWAAKCQDCHMRDVVGVGCNKKGVPVRPDESTEHPESGMPLHDLTGGNVWVSHILASIDPNGPVYDPVNAQILGQGPAVLTLDLSGGQSPLSNGPALKAGSDRAAQQLRLAATFTDASYDPATGALTFRVLNNTGHRLISGFPEGRRMFVNVKAYSGGALVWEVNPYDDGAGTLRGLSHPSSPALGPNEVYLDELVYEVHPSSTLTGEDETFHFVLATGRYKDNRIPPKGFDLAIAEERLCAPVDHGDPAPGLFTGAEYAGGYDEVGLSLPAGADGVELTLYYQGTSREYIEFLRDEIAGTASTLPSEAYVIQNDPFFDGLRAWGPAIWQLWEHNHGLDGSGVQVPGIVPFAMTELALGDGGGGGGGCTAPVPSLLSAVGGQNVVSLEWSDEHSADPGVVGYRVWYDQAGKSQLVADVGLTTTYVDSGLTNNIQYCYKVSSLVDADGDGLADCESDMSNILCATPTTAGHVTMSVASLETGYYERTGKGKNQTVTWVPSSSFTVGQAVVVRALLVETETGLPVEGATMTIDVVGPEAATLTSTSSGPDGFAEATWQTQSPNKKGNGGTTTGAYDATVTDVTAAGHSWDGAPLSVPFTLQ
jgi:hypothetical protein